MGDGATAIHGARLHLLPGLCEGVSGPTGRGFFAGLCGAATPTPPPEGDPGGLYKGQGVYNICPRKFPLIFTPDITRPRSDIARGKSDIISAPKVISHG